MSRAFIFKDKFSAGSRTYYFDIKKTRQGKPYLSITESHKKGDDFEKAKILVFEDHIESFSKSLNTALLNFYKANSSSNKSNYQKLVKAEFENAYSPWTEELDDELEALYCQGCTNDNLSQHFRRNLGGILARIKKLQLDEKYPDIRN